MLHLKVEGQLIMFTAHTVGRTKYQITGCAGQGGFAQVYKAYVNCNPDDVVAFKVKSTGLISLLLMTSVLPDSFSFCNLWLIQKPAFPWEFYMYYCIVNLINGSQARNILVSDYLAGGTLQDAINLNTRKTGPY
ncbi:mitotic checkpoint serine/threonine-protein kinase BUB1-like isoform X2 [Malus domestica]|uniref:mitotic checkpoint serine/threonine-protein kinase BUB1-like isoform X2 n=1 Tax=Malus domestica TaxID=3750 RepID=UPI003975ED00